MNIDFTSKEIHDAFIASKSKCVFSFYQGWTACYNKYELEQKQDEKKEIDHE